MLVCALVILLFATFGPCAECAVSPNDAADALPDSLRVDLGGGVEMEFVLIRPGSFVMGTNNHEYDEGPAHSVTISRPFYLAKFEVTQAQWARVTGSNPSHFRGETLPVDTVSWLDCQRFLTAATQLTGRRFSLPTEAQWEFACRAGATTEYAFGDEPGQLTDHAWYSGNSALSTHPVGTKQPNRWGLHDMHGNVYEWCADWYSEAPYDNSASTDPVGPATGRRRVLRGGAWLFVADNLRCSDRAFSPPDYASNEYGVRPVILVEAAAATPNAPAAAATPNYPAQPSNRFAQRLERAIADEDALQAEFWLNEWLNESAKEPHDSEQLEKLRRQIAALARPAETLSLEIAPGVVMEFVLIRPGWFTMGSDTAPSLHERPAHRVAISGPYYLGKYEVTQQQWEAVMSRNPSAYGGGEPGAVAGQLPVEGVNWALCQSFMEKLNALHSAHEFRLPTEAEWEYACRAGSEGLVPTRGDLDNVAWHGGNSGARTHPVGGKRPNAWGLYDMCGNVWEWCQDRFARYPAEPVFDPTGPSLSDGSVARVLRGGGWNNSADHVNASFRHDASPSAMMRFYGFRCAVLVKPRASASNSTP
jgi:formylglycine-generating enzyme required for sulfatase activity